MSLSSYLVTGYRFVHKTELFDVKTKIECGASCNHYGEGCDLWIYLSGDLECHIGIFNNPNENWLSGQSGNDPVYVKIGKL